MVFSDCYRQLGLLEHDRVRVDHQLVIIILQQPKIIPATDTDIIIVVRINFDLFTNHTRAQPQVSRIGNELPNIPNNHHGLHLSTQGNQPLTLRRKGDVIILLDILMELLRHLSITVLLSQVSRLINLDHGLVSLLSYRESPKRLKSSS